MKLKINGYHRVDSHCPVLIFQIQNESGNEKKKVPVNYQLAS